jgi:hypothetical protein
MMGIFFNACRPQTPWPLRIMHKLDNGGSSWPILRQRFILPSLRIGAASVGKS